MWQSPPATCFPAALDRGELDGVLADADRRAARNGGRGVWCRRAGRDGTLGRWADGRARRGGFCPSGGRDRPRTRHGTGTNGLLADTPDADFEPAVRTGQHATVIENSGAPAGARLRSSVCIRAARTSDTGRDDLARFADRLDANRMGAGSPSGQQQRTRAVAGQPERPGRSFHHRETGTTDLEAEPGRRGIRSAPAVP